MSPSPVTFSSPVLPSSYSWEATDEGVAARFGLPIDQVVRFDLNTSPTPPRLFANSPIMPTPSERRTIRSPHL